MRFLIATGGSPHSSQAVAFGLTAAQSVDAQVTLLAVTHGDLDEEAARRLLAAEATHWRGSPDRLRSKVRGGQAAAEITRELTETHYDLVILGHHSGHSLLTRLLGSTVDHVVKHTPCSVLIVQGAINPLTRVLICDAGASSPSVLDRLIESRLAALLPFSADIEVLHVMSQISAGPSVRGEELEADAETLIREQTPEGGLLLRDRTLLAAQGYQPRVKVRHGFVVDEIEAEVREGGYHLIIIGAHRSLGWQGLLLDDIAQQVVLTVGCPVLLVR